MKNVIIQVLNSLFVLAIMTVGFIFIGAFVEYKALNGANIYASMSFGFAVCFSLAAATYVTIKELLKGY